MHVPSVDGITVSRKSGRGRSEMKNYGTKLAEIALEIGAIRLSPEKPFRWVSGYRMPVYNDNRQLLARSDARALIAEAFAALLEEIDFVPENIAGTATAGIPHATTLADRLALPLSYVRSSGKDHGLGNQIEGLGAQGTYENARVVLIEDLISTGGSSISAVHAIREKNGICPWCLAIFTYGFDAATDAFKQLNHSCEYRTILDYQVMVETALKTGYIDEEGAELLKSWREDPFGWGAARGFPREQ